MEVFFVYNIFIMAIDSEELLLVVDKFDQPTGISKRSALREDPDKWFRIAIVLVTSGDKILCHKRPSGLDVNPSLWTMPFGGHANPGESPTETARKELVEESGIQAESADLDLVMVYPDRNDRKIKWIFSLEVDQNCELKLEEEEVEEVKWYSRVELTEIYKNKDSGWTHSGYEQAVLSFLLDNR